ncbi:hypothetical protein RBG61_05240 [Paludicola sp. MB14-C6]|uniref:hypothetical protein n=1 Tax=Paludihabitans sp. MB14-C6 TaxID=3070656 RepID=UPI0027DC2A9F|nr:hypothetical protein [Paludicola sp. MB14-C6]WMJ24075.1 hypothetical protein RBG61_05240 [Paludicola sp. MB14-C6]
MKINNKHKYLPYIIIVCIILVLGGVLAWRELRKAINDDVMAQTAPNSKNSAKEVISSDNVTLSNGRKVTVEFQLTDVMAIQDYNQFGNGPKDNYIYYGQGQIQVLDSDYKSKILDTYKINAVDYYMPQLSCLKPSQFTFQDYNNDKNLDFTLVQSNPYLGSIFYIYTINNSGKISRLDTDGFVHVNSYTHGNLSAQVDCYKGVFFGSNCYYRWNKTKFDKIDESKIGFEPLNYNKNGIEKIVFYISEQPSISFNSASIIPNSTDVVNFGCKLDMKANGIEIFVRSNERTLFIYTYYYKTNSVLQSNTSSKDNLKLSDDQLEEIGKICKAAMDYALKDKGLTEFIE